MRMSGLRPANGPPHGAKRIRVSGRITEALIERHLNIAAQRQLDIDRSFGRKEMRIAVEMRVKQHTLLGDLADRIQAEDLKSAGIGEDGTGPSHEAMQAAHAL